MWLGAVLLAVLMMITPSSASENMSGWHHGMPFVYKEGLLDYLKFPRAKLSENGVDMHLSGLVIGQSIVNGGISEESELSASYDLQVYLDSAKLGLWNGAYALLRAEGKTDDAGVNPYTGAIIPVNFDAMVPSPEGEGFRMTEWWFAQGFADGNFEVLLGMWDIGRFFDLVPFSGPYHYRFINAHNFFNSVLLPYAPYNILGGIATIKPAKWINVTTAIGDPHSTALDVDWFSEGDINLYHEWRFMSSPFGKPGWYTAGLTYTNQEQATIAQDPDPATTNTKDSDWAFYLNFSQWLYQNPDNHFQAIGLFGRIGFTDGEVAIIKNHFSLGISFDGMISARPKDVFGIVGWYNRFSDDLPDNLDDSSYGFEAYYRFQLGSWLQLSPDIQYLIDPGIAGGDDTVVLGLRALFLF